MYDAKVESSDPPPMTRDSARPRAKRSVWKTLGAIVLACLALALVLLLLAWWFVRPGGPLHSE
jgi:hypothetical protein